MQKYKYKRKSKQLNALRNSMLRKIIRKPMKIKKHKNNYMTEKIIDPMAKNAIISAN